VERILAHQLCAQSGQVTFRKPGEALEQMCRYDAVENAVAQELQAFVVGGAVTAMRERLGQEFRPGKTVTDMLLQALLVHGLVADSNAA
jgi:hypothetical protein